MNIAQSRKNTSGLDWTVCDRNQHVQRKKGNTTFVKEALQ